VVLGSRALSAIRRHSSALRRHRPALLLLAPMQDDSDNPYSVPGRRIFNIRVVASETRFEIAELGERDRGAAVKRRALSGVRRSRPTALRPIGKKGLALVQLQRL
jgi:hypothetical protein